MRALVRYSIAEALISVARGWRTNVLSVAVIAAAVFAGAGVLLVSVNVQRILDRLATTAELRIYLRDGASTADRDEVARRIAESPAVASSSFVDASAALERFKREAPELAALVGALDENPLPAAFEVRLREGDTGLQARALADALTRTGRVEDVRYDRQVLDRLSDGLRTARKAGAAVAVLLILAAIVTITSVLRLSYLSRRDETDVLCLIGVPPGAIRGPFIVEGVLQALVGALVALVLLLFAFGVANAQYGVAIAQAFGVSGLVFLSLAWGAMVCATAMIVGGLAGLGAAWKQS